MRIRGFGEAVFAVARSVIHVPTRPHPRRAIVWLVGGCVAGAALIRMAGRRPTCQCLVFTPRLTLKRAVATAAMTGAAGAAVFSAAAAFTTISTLATTATLFGMSGGADSACPSSITISPSTKTSARFDKSLTIPVSGLSVNGAQCQGSGVFVGGPHSVFAGENNVDRPLGQVKKVCLDTGVQLLERQLLQASGNDFDVFFFPLDADTPCGSWRVS